MVAVDFAGGAELDPAATPPTLLDRIVGQTGDTLIAAAIVLSTIIFVSLGMRPAMRLIVESRKPALEATQRTEEPKLVQVSGEPALESDSRPDSPADTGWTGCSKAAVFDQTG